MNLQNKLTKLKSDFLGHAHYDNEIQVKNLDELVQYLDNFKIPNDFQTNFIHLNTPIQLNYIDNESYSPICDEDILTQNKSLINNMANYHLSEKLDFYAGIREPNESDESEIQMFSNYLIKNHFKLKKGESIIIPEPKIIMSSQNKIAFPTIYDERTFTIENLEFDKNKFRY